MADVKSFIDQLRTDVTATYVPAVQAAGPQIAATAGPRFGPFIEQLVKDVFAQQSQPVGKFLTG
jgi:hypothetical protein